MALLDLSDAFDASFLERVLLKQTNRRLDDKGEWVEVGFSVIAIDAVVLPFTSEVTGSEMNTYLNEAIRVYSTSPLMHQSSDEFGYSILYNNKEYRIDSVEDYQHFGAGFSVATCQLFEQGE